MKELAAAMRGGRVRAMPPNDADLQRLLHAAAEVRKRAHAPYSGFPVGAAVLAGGRVYAACNVENSSFPLSVCAERNAVGMAVASGARRIDAVAVVGGSARPAPPCGGCRQVIAEFAGAQVPVVYATPAGRRVATTVGALLPSAFGAADLRGADRESTGTRERRPRAASGRARSAARARGSRRTGR